MLKLMKHRNTPEKVHFKHTTFQTNSLILECALIVLNQSALKQN